MSGEPSLQRRAIAEFVGTAVLVLVGPGAIMVAARSGAFGHAGVSAAFGAVVFGIVAVLGPISGAHINPAVSLGLALHGQTRWRDAAAYVLAQSLGAIVAALTLVQLLGPIADVGATVPTVSRAAAFVVECGYTAIIGAAVAAVHRGRIAASHAAGSLGVIVGLGALVTGPLTGGSFNPARTLGPAVAAGQWTAHWLYWLAPLVGFSIGYAALAALSPAPRPTPS